MASPVGVAPFGDWTFSDKRGSQLRFFHPRLVNEDSREPVGSLDIGDCVCSSGFLKLQNGWSNDTSIVAYLNPDEGSRAMIAGLQDKILKALRDGLDDEILNGREMNFNRFFDGDSVKVKVDPRHSAFVSSDCVNKKFHELNAGPRGAAVYKSATVAVEVNLLLWVNYSPDKQYVSAGVVLKAKRVAERAAFASEPSGGDGGPSGGDGGPAEPGRERPGARRASGPAEEPARKRARGA